MPQVRCKLSPSDESLVSQAAELGDMEAFAEIVRRHRKKILLLQRRLTGEVAMAEDLTQETFIRAWERLGTFRGTGSFGAWLASLSYNVFRAHWRRSRNVQAEVSLDDANPAGEQIVDAGLADPAVSADLDRLLSVLSREDQVIMVLTYAYGLSNPEIGAVLEMPVGTVKARIHRAKARIRAWLDAPGGRAEADSERPPEMVATRKQRAPITPLIGVLGGT
jgi:RNA polymerase sigma-70 factor (ECF subfamily)